MSREKLCKRLTFNNAFDNSIIIAFITEIKMLSVIDIQSKYTKYDTYKNI